MQAFSRWLEATALSQAIQQNIWLIELLQIIHILCVGLVLSSVVMLAMRVAGAARMRDQTLAQTVRRFMPWFWAAFAGLAASGTILIVGEPHRTLVDNPAFQAKLVLLALALAAALVFHVSLKHRAALWNEDMKRSAPRRLLAIAGVVLFCAIVVAGRWIAYMGPD